MRHAVSQLLRIAAALNCGPVSIESLNLRDARATGRETMGRAKRGKRFRRTVASMPTAAFRDRLVAMACNRGVAVIAVDSAYTTKWGREHWLAHLNESRLTPCSGHHAAAVVIGRRALGLSAKRRSTARDGTTGTRQRTGPQPQRRGSHSKSLQAKPTAPGRDTEDAREIVKRHRDERREARTARKRRSRDVDMGTRTAPTSGHRNRSRCPPSRRHKPSATN